MWKIIGLLLLITGAVGMSSEISAMQGDESLARISTPVIPVGKDFDPNDFGVHIDSDIIHLPFNSWNPNAVEIQILRELQKNKAAGK